MSSPCTPRRRRAHLLSALAPLPLLVLGALLLVAWGSSVVSGAQANLTWDAPLNDDGTPVTNLGGYKIYRGTTSGSYSQSFTTGTGTTYTDSSLSDGTTYYYTVTAFDSHGSESSRSNEVSKAIPGGSPTVPPPASTSPAVPKTGWKLYHVDSQETKAADRAATNAFDGSAATAWITDWATTNAPHPHEIQIDLGQSYDLDSFSYLPPQDGSVNGRIARYEFYVGTPGNWGAAVTSGTFVNDGTQKTVLFGRKSGRYIRLRALAEVNGNPWTTVAELGVTGVATPGSTIPAPSTPGISSAGWKLLYADSQETRASNRAATNAFDGNAATMWITDWSTTNAPHPHEIQIDLGQAYDLDSFTCLPPQDGSINGRIARYEFYVSSGGDWGTAVATGTFANDASAKKVAFPRKTGRYIRLRALSEVNGNPWTSLAELQVTGTASTATSASPAIPRTGWKLEYVDSQETKAANRAAVNAFDGNTASLWITDWATTNATHPHEIQIDLGQSYNVDSFTYLPPQDGSVNGRIARYEFYASTSTTAWGTAVASGTFANDASAKQVKFPKTSARYIRLRALSEVNGNPWTSAAEISVTGTP